MTMPKRMYINFLHSCLFNMPFHCMLHSLCHHWKQSFIFLILVQTFPIKLNFICKKYRNFYCPNGIVRLRFCNNICPVHTVISFPDMNLTVFQINIFHRKCEHFCFCQVKTKKNILFLQRKSTTKSLTFRDAFQLPVTFLLCYAPAGVSFISGISAGLITFRFSGISSEKKMSSVFQIISTLSAP